MGTAALLLGQEIVVNPERPLNLKAGRVLQLKEELRITDDGGQFFLRFPRIGKVAPDNSLFFLDFDSLVHLDAKDRYLGNYFKKGQGPGEFNYVSNFDIAQDHLIVHSNSPGKIVWFDFQGKIVKEISLTEMPRLSFLFFAHGVYHFFKYGVPETSEKLEVINFPQVLIAADEDGREVRELITFPNRGFRIGGVMVMQELLFTSCQHRHLFVSHTREYCLKMVDCQEGRLLRVFQRKYKRVKPPKDHREAAIVIGAKRYEAPGSEYLGDVNDLFVFKDVLWVVTSTKDEKKGVLVDVYDFMGRYIDAFFLKFNVSLIGTHGDSILVREKGPDDLIQIVKYRVVD